MGSQKKVAWRVAGRIILLLIAYLFVVVVLQFLGADFMGIDLAKFQDLTLQENLIMQCLGFIGTFGVVFLFRRYLDRKSFGSLGFSFKDRWRDLLVGGALAAVLIGVGTLVIITSGDVSFTYNLLDWNSLGYAWMLFLLVALCEEVFVRGYVLNNLLSVTNRYLALVISSIIFMLMHGLNPNMSGLGWLNLFLAGLLLGSTYVYTQNLWFPISLHLFWNFIQGSVLDYNVSGLDINSILSFEFTSVTSLNGGKFGFEGSIICTILSLIAIIGIHVYFLRKEKSKQDRAI
ncbi:MAG: CPBP family intramembrane metalloprotease [Marinilabiliaceae bacterium]|nr:CPBP family intramembrane metalloprotease [Marinilabiliaceae bacterium]